MLLDWLGGSKTKTEGMVTRAVKQNELEDSIFLLIGYVDILSFMIFQKFNLFRSLLLFFLLWY